MIVDAEGFGRFPPSMEQARKALLSSSVENAQKLPLKELRRVFPPMGKGPSYHPLEMILIRRPRRMGRSNRDPGP